MTSILRKIVTVGSRLRDLYLVLMLARFSVLTLLVGVAFLIFVPQGQEVLRQLSSGPPVQWLFFMAAALLWALSSWYWARTMLSFRFPEWPPAHDPADPGRTAWVKGCHKWVPRTIGGLSILTVTAALVVAGMSLHRPAREPATGSVEQHGLWILAAVSAAIAVGFSLFVHLRRKWFRRFFPVAEQDMPPTDAYRLIADVPRVTLSILLGSLAFALVSFIVFTVRPWNLAIAPLLGAATILLLAAAAWVPAGSAVVYVGNQTRFPVLFVLGLLLVLFSLFNDNHRVRVLPAPTSPAVAPSLGDHISGWLADLETRTRGSPTPPGDGNRRLPAFIVAAEGGGIRAGYWTGIVLAGIEDRYPGFHRRVFAISGVSGGSLGAAVFTALAAEQEASGAPCQGAGGAAQPSFTRCTVAALSQDFIAPALASMLYPDLVQRFLPVPFDYLDRAVTLEQSWEAAWRQATGNDRFAEPFGRLWRDTSRTLVPALILNGTSVEHGNRLLASNLPLSSGVFLDAADLRAALGGEMRLSTAVNNSARFTYVSPAGKVGDGLHVVDGGYFENSGATTAAETLAAILARVPSTVVPVVIHISNDPVREAGRTTRTNELASEVLAPALALLNARSARGDHARLALKQRVEGLGGYFLHFALEDTSVPLPLGWALSRSAALELDAQLERYFRCGARTRSNASVLRELLGPAAIPCA